MNQQKNKCRQPRRREFLIGMGAAAFAAESEQSLQWARSIRMDDQDGPESAFYVSDSAIIGSPFVVSNSAAQPEPVRELRRVGRILLEGLADGGLYIHALSTAGQRAAASRSTCSIRRCNPGNELDGLDFPIVAPRRADVHKEGE
ncbi:MAG: hypothetical protein WKF37_05125 [Bryobacteraceae bacterium]